MEYRRPNRHGFEVCENDSSGQRIADLFAKAKCFSQQQPRFPLVSELAYVLAIQAIDPSATVPQSIAKMEIENARLAKANTDYQEADIELRAGSKWLEEQRTAWEKTATELKKYTLELQEEIAQFHNEIARLRDEVAQKEAQVEQLKAKHSLIH